MVQSRRKGMKHFKLCYAQIYSQLYQLTESSVFIVDFSAIMHPGLVWTFAGYMQKVLYALSCSLVDSTA